MNSGSGANPKKPDFFIGWLGRLPRRTREVVIASALGLILGFGLTALVVGASQNDPGDGAIRWGSNVAERGVILAQPYPHLRTEPSAEHPDGQTFLLTLPGKRGAQPPAEQYDGQVVDVTGVWSRRGDIALIQLAGADAVKPSAAPGSVELTPVENRGYWRISGEICDGKCWLGAMRPGAGVAHKACANLCLTGGAPPVLVLTQPVEGSEFLLLADPQGKPLGEDLKGLTAILLTLEGALERRGDLLVFKVDLSQAVVL